MFDKGLTESEKEIKNSPERKKHTAVKCLCAMVCITLVGGYIYYETHPEKFNTMENTYVEIDDNSEKEFDDFLKNYELSDNEKQELNNNIVKVNKNVIEKSFAGTKQMFTDAVDLISNRREEDGVVMTGYDRNGHPYLKKGAEYTFGADGYPIEAPYDTTKFNEITHNGRTFAYNETSHKWYDEADVDKTWKIAEGMAKGLNDADGNTNVHPISQEARDAVKWSVNIGAMDIQ